MITMCTKWLKAVIRESYEQLKVMTVNDTSGTRMRWRRSYNHMMLQLSMVVICIVILGYGHFNCHFNCHFSSFTCVLERDRLGLLDPCTKSMQLYVRVSVSEVVSVCKST